VEVEWKTSWWPAVIREVRDGEYYIHYDKHDNSWDEWVPPARIRLPNLW